MTAYIKPVIIDMLVCGYYDIAVRNIRRSTATDCGR